MTDVLDIDLNHVLQLTPNDVVGQRIAILGISGSGKTNTAAVLIEETLQQGIPLTIVDIEGEYWGLKERYELLIVGRGPMVDLEIGIEQAAQIAEFSLRQRLTVILDLSEFKLDQAFALLLAYFERLWELASLERKPYGIVLEEASEFIPQGAATPLKNILKTISSRGRKKGLSLTMINQRATTLEKNALTQARLLFLHNVVYPSDLRVYEDLLPLPPREIEAINNGLQPGQAIVRYQAAIQVVQVRLRHTFHAGATPSLDGTGMPALRRIDERMLAQLRQSLSNPATSAPGAEKCKDEIERLLESSVKWQKLAEERGQEVEKLKRQLGDAPKPTATPSPRPAAPSKPTAPAPVGAPSLQEQRAAARLSSATQRSINRQTEGFQRVIANVQVRSEKHHLEALLFLNANEGRSIPLEELARHLGYKLESLYKNPPKHLFALGWLERTKGAQTFNYRSHLTARLKEDFPDLDTPSLIDQIQQLVK